MLTFDFICISVLEATPDAKVFLSLLVEIWVCQLRSVGFGRPAGVMVWASLEDIRWTAGSAFLFSSSGQPCGAFVVPRQNWKGSFRGFLLFLFLFFLLFFFRCCFLSGHIMRWKSEIVTLLRLTLFAVPTELSPSRRVWIVYLFIYSCPRPPPPPLPTKRTFDSSVLSAMLWGASEAENGFNTTRAGVWTLLIDELRFIATRVAA